MLHQNKIDKNLVLSVRDATAIYARKPGRAYSITDEQLVSIENGQLIINKAVAKKFGLTIQYVNELAYQPFAKAKNELNWTLKLLHDLGHAIHVETSDGNYLKHVTYYLDDHFDLKKLPEVPKNNFLALRVGYTTLCTITKEDVLVHVAEIDEFLRSMHIALFEQIPQGVERMNGTKFSCAEDFAKALTPYNMQHCMHYIHGTYLDERDFCLFGRICTPDDAMSKYHITAVQFYTIAQGIYHHIYDTADKPAGLYMW